jgi:hypothetical protein
MRVEEKAKTYLLGLHIGFFSPDDVVKWADSVICDNTSFNYNFIEISLAKSKGINEIIRCLENIDGQIESGLSLKVLLGLIYLQLLSGSEIQEITRQLYDLSQYISSDYIDEEKIRWMNTFDDIFYLYGNESVKIQLLDFLKEYEPYIKEF